MYLYEDQFSEGYDFQRVDKPSKVLIIASTQRCGSHMLGHALQKTESFGFPLEYTNPPNLHEWKKRLGMESFHQVLAEIQRRRTSPNGVFSIKIHYSQIKEFGGFEKLQALFPSAYYILLTRKSVLRQAVSLSIASQTGVWISGQRPVNANPKYSFEHIKECLRKIILDNSSWRYLLAASGCNYIEVEFEDFCNNPEESTKEIAAFLGVAVASEKVPKEQATKKQSSKINEDWTDRFISEFDSSEELFA
jgi:LPS sulfotransferase NodH